MRQRGNQPRRTRAPKRRGSALPATSSTRQAAAIAASSARSASIVAWEGATSGASPASSPIRQTEPGGQAARGAAEGNKISRQHRLAVKHFGGFLFGQYHQAGKSTNDRHAGRRDTADPAQFRNDRIDKLEKLPPDGGPAINTGASVLTTHDTLICALSATKFPARTGQELRFDGHYSTLSRPGYFCRPARTPAERRPRALKFSERIV
jgi:hypothetical protein